MIDLTERQIQCLRYLYQYIKEYGYPPSLREVMNEMGISSLRCGQTHLESLERKGMITRPKKCDIGSNARAIQIQPKGLAYLGENPIKYPEYFVPGTQPGEWIQIPLHRAGVPF